MKRKPALVTAAQRRALFAACAAAAVNLGEDPEEYRKRIMREKVGAEHLAEVSRTDGFDRLMSQAKADAGDFLAAADYAVGSFRRMRHLCLAAAGKIAAQGSSSNARPTRYIAGVMVQMRFSRETVDSLDLKLQREAGWEDFTEHQLRSVLSALTAHVRRRRSS